MKYAQAHCSIEYDPQNQTYTYKGKCILTGKPHQVTVSALGVDNYNQGVLIQDAFPYLSVDDREFLMSGFGPGEFDEIYGGEIAE